MSSIVTMPMVPPYSSVTTAMWALFFCKRRSSLAMGMFSETNIAGFVTSRSAALPPATSRKKSLLCTTPMMLSMEPSYTGRRE